MNRDEYGHLLAERGALQRILEGIPSESVLVRRSFLARLDDVEHRIEAAGSTLYRPAQARLMFRGQPVVGGRAISADFGTSATKAFVDAVVAAAAGLTGPLAHAGPIPNRDRYQLLITSTVVGSFGFDLEEHRPDQFLLPGESPVAIALVRIQDLFRSVIDTDDQLADAAVSVHPRALATVRSFLELLVRNDAVCSVEVGDTAVSFRDVGQVRRSLERLSQDNLREERRTFVGTLQGVLPARRTFEFRASDGDDVITGKVGPGIEDPDVLNQHLHQPTRIQVTAVRVGRGRPRYVLNELPVWSGQNGSGRG